MRVVRLDRGEVPEIVGVLAESFSDYPVMRFVLGDAPDGYEKRLRTLVHLFVMARVFREEVLLGIRDQHELLGTALVSRPGGPGAPPQFRALREKIWAELGTDAERRYDALGEAWAPMQVDVPHLHLNMIGVRRRARGSGVGRYLLDAVHDMSASDQESSGVTLTTEDPGNVSLYQHFGYQIIGTAVVGPGITTWGFYRQDEAGPAER
jgi:ribosomal protein S18 acetylase RimI-like enzyme